MSGQFDPHNNYALCQRVRLSDSFEPTIDPTHFIFMDQPVL